MSEFYTNVRVFGNKILYSGIKNNRKIRYKDEFQPTLYVSSNKPSSFKSITGQFVDEIKPGSIKDTKEFIKKYKDISNFDILGDISSEIQFLSEKFKNPIEWNIKDLSVHVIDIETSTENSGFPNPYQAQEEILLITVLNINTKKFVTFCSKAYTGESIPDKNVDIRVYKDEYSLLEAFLKYWNEIEIDVVSGWNIDNFDIPYLVNRIKNIFDDDTFKQLSPWNIVNIKTKKDQYGKEFETYDIYGVSCLDYINLYKKFTYVNRESYSLEHISTVELGVGKLNHDEFATFKDFYTNGWNKFIQYNIEDCDRVGSLESKLKLIELALTLAYLAKVNYNDVFSPIKTWDSIIYNHLKQQNIAIPSNSNVSKTDKFEGAYVKEPIPGLYKWIVSFDATSLYPSIIQAWNISPETLLGIDDNITVTGLLDSKYTLSSDYCTAANGAMYKNDKKGLIPELIDIFMNKRKSSKSNMLAKQNELEILKTTEYNKTDYKNLENEISKYDNLQMAFKILMNSLYGAIGNSSCRYFELENARAITLTGQFIIKYIAQGLNQDLSKLFKIDKEWVFYCDTDSNYLTLDSAIEKLYPNVPEEKLLDIVDKIAKDKISKLFDKHCLNLQSYCNTIRNTIVFKREAISTSGVWVVKKRYFLNVMDNEGVRYNAPKLKIMGLEAIKSSTPGFCREKLKECYKLILSDNQEALQAFIADFKTEFKSLSVEGVSFPTSVNGLGIYGNDKNIYKGGAPFHVKGALLYNKCLVDFKLQNKYPKIGEGDKIKCAYLKLPNPLKDTVIGFTSELPVEFGLHEYIDYDKQFEKSFLKPLETILNILNWSVEKTYSIDDFFN